MLAGHSAGAGVALRALESLPADQQVDGLVLMAPAVSRTYDLTPALRRLRGRAHAFTSNRDTLVLAVGTSLFGTADGVHGEAAGHGGFVRPEAADRDAYSKLQTHRYSRARRRLGDSGSHMGVLTPRVAQGLVAPLLPGFGPPDRLAGKPAAAPAAVATR